VPNHDKFQQNSSLISRATPFPALYRAFSRTFLVKIPNFRNSESAKAPNLHPVFKKVFSNAEKCDRIK
jgi:hypothetical protein